MNIIYRPMKEWPANVKLERLRSPFKAEHGPTLSLIEREIRMIDGRDGVIELALHEKQFTREGLPYRDATPEHPGIIVRTRKPVINPRGQRDMVPLYFPAGRYSKWQHNLRAVALAMEALRMIDRYGVTQNSQQYLGFGKYLPGPTHEGVMTVDAAARFIGNEGGPVPFESIIRSVDTYRASYKRAAAQLHPDKGGDPVQWEKLQAAKTLLDEYHKPR
jgi:hypothetical protein